MAAHRQQYNNPPIFLNQTWFAYQERPTFKGQAAPLILLNSPGQNLWITAVLWLINPSIPPVLLISTHFINSHLIIRIYFTISP